MEDSWTASRTPRATRPLRVRLAYLSAAALDADAPFLPPPPLPSSDARGAPWHSLVDDVIASVALLRAGRFVDLLRSACARELLAPVRPSEWRDVSPHSSASLLAQAGGAPDLSDASFLTARVFAARAARWALYGEGDAFFVDDASAPTDTPAHWRAFGAALVAAACLALFSQANVTGPELDAAAVADVYPLPYAASLLPIADAVTSGSDAAGPSPASVQSTRHWEALPSIEAETVPVSAGANDDDASDTPAALRALAALLGKDATPLQAASLSALTLPTGEEPFLRIEFPHFLATARALLGALVTPVVGGATHAMFEAEAHLSSNDAFGEHGGVMSSMSSGTARRAAVEDEDEDDPFPVIKAAPEDALDASAAATAASPQGTTVRDPRVRALHALTDALPGVQWLAARSVLAHQRVLVERTPSHLLWRECCALFARVAQSHCPEYLLAFSDSDLFRRRLVSEELASTGSSDRAVGDLSSADEDAAEENAIECIAAAAAARPAGPRPRTARLLLEWGLAQHFFSRAAAAKTSFFLAKRETGLATHVRGALGKRTKFQTFNVAQLVLRATSVGTEAAAAVEQAVAAEAAGAARGRFTADALRERGLLAATESSGEGALAPAVEDQLSERVEGGDQGETGLPPPTFVLGTLREVTHAETDAHTELLERMEEVGGEGGKAAGLDEEGSAYEGTPNSVFQHSKGWGKSMELSLAAGRPLQPAPTAASLSIVEDGPLSILDQCLTLALCLDIRNHNPRAGLTQEEMRPYAERVLDTPLNWMVHSSGLLVRALLEFENHKTAERAALQLQALVDQHTTRLTVMQARRSTVEASAPAASRLSHAPCLPFPPRWDLQRTTADKYLKLGAVRAALELYEGLGLWEDVIECYAALDWAGRAERLVRRCLAVRPHPRLWCLLGGITNRDEYYERGWELSGGRFAKAQLALGRRAFERGDFEGASAALARGLPLAPGEEKSWFLAGVVAMRLGRFTAALEAYSRVVQLDATRADAWANLGAVHLHLREWSKGYAAYEQAIRQDRRDWRMWANFLIAAVRTRNYSRALRVQITLVDLIRERGAAGAGGAGSSGTVGSGDVDETQGVNLAALTQLAQAVLASAEEERERQEQEERVEGSGATPSSDAGGETSPGRVFSSSVSAPPLNLELNEDTVGFSNTDLTPRQHTDAGGAPAVSHLPALLTTLGHVTATVTRLPRLWALYAAVQEEVGEYAAALECRLRQVRALQATPGWERDAAAISAIAPVCLDIAEGYERVNTREGRVAASMLLDTIASRVRAGVVQAEHPALKDLDAARAHAAGLS